MLGVPLAAAPTVVCPVRAVPVVLLASPHLAAPLGTGDAVGTGGTAWRLGAAGRGGWSRLSPVPAPRRRRRKRRVSIAPRFQLPPCLYGRGIPTGGCCEGTECAGLLGRSGLGGDGDCRAANAVALARQRLSRPRGGARGEAGAGARSTPLPCWWAPESGCRSVSHHSGNTDTRVLQVLRDW